MDGSAKNDSDDTPSTKMWVKEADRKISKKKMCGILLLIGAPIGVLDAWLKFDIGIYTMWLGAIVMVLGAGLLALAFLGNMTGISTTRGKGGQKYTTYHYATPTMKQASPGLKVMLIGAVIIAFGLWIFFWTVGFSS